MKLLIIKISCYIYKKSQKGTHQSFTITYQIHNIALFALQQITMKLSPLRKEVQSLNQELLSQNVQIQDLITFLKKQPKTNHQQSIKHHVNQYESPNNYLNKISNKKTQILTSFCTNSQNQIQNKQNLQKQSLEKFKPFHPQQTKNGNILKSNQKKQIPMTKSVTFHNIQNALTARRYLKLSRPEKKLNASCTFCRQPSTLIASNFVKQSTNQTLSPTFQTIQNPKLNSNFQSQKKSFKSLQKLEDRQKIKSISKTKRKIPQRELPKTEKKKNPLKQLDSNEILSKNQVKKIIEKKSLPMPNSAKMKTKLSLKDEKILEIKSKQKK